MLIEDFADQEFSMVLEDGSQNEIGEMLVLMWHQCSQGDFTLVQNAIAREQARQSAVTQSQGLEGGDIVDEEGQTDDVSNETLLEEHTEPEGPIIDEDGFQQVTRKKLPRKCKK